MARLGRGEVKRLLESNGLRPSKAFGQNFVVDPNTVERIARIAQVGPGDKVLEIGAGLGALTLALCATGAEVTAVEIDKGLGELLCEIVPSSVRVVIADALTLDWRSLLGAGSGADVFDQEPDSLGNNSWTLVANLPYNIAALLVIDLLERVPQIHRMLIMVQREVGERLAAGAGSRAYGVSSVKVAYFAQASIAGHVSPEVFHPRPNVDSVLVSLERFDTPAVDLTLASYEEIGVLVKAGFSGRRKMLRRSLAGLVDESCFEAAGVAPTARAEQLDIVAWGKLAGCRSLKLSTPTQS